MRTLARSVAYANMRKANLSGVNRKHGTAQQERVRVKDYEIREIF